MNVGHKPESFLTTAIASQLYVMLALWRLMSQDRSHSSSFHIPQEF